MPFWLSIVIALFACSALAAFGVLSFRSYRWALKNHKTASKAQLLQSRKSILLYNTLLLIALALLELLNRAGPGRALTFLLILAVLLRVGIRHGPPLLLLNYFLLGLWARQAEDRSTGSPSQAPTLPGWVVLLLLLPSIINMIGLILIIVPGFYPS